MRLEFGKHKGQDIADVPTQYLEWLLRADVNALSAGGKLHVERELHIRRQKDEHNRRAYRERYEQSFRGESWGEEPRRSQALVGVSVMVPRQRLALMQELIECGFKALSMRLHPDKGGTTAQMQELNELRTHLKEQLAKA